MPWERIQSVHPGKISVCVIVYYLCQKYYMGRSTPCGSTSCHFFKGLQQKQSWGLCLLIRKWSDRKTSERLVFYCVCMSACVWEREKDYFLTERMCFAPPALWFKYKRIKWVLKTNKKKNTMIGSKTATHCQRKKERKKNSSKVQHWF